MGYLKQLFEELKRRNIYKVAIVYGITGWVIVQMAAIASSTFGAPGWVMKMLITVVLLGFPVAVILAWAFEITPDGIKRTREVSKSESINQRTGSKLNYWIITLLSAVSLFFIIENFWFDQSASISARPATEAGVPSVAVLPFEDFSAKGNKEWFADGLTEEILNSLARLRGLKVAARTSSFYFKNKNIPIQQIADTLGVEHIVEGSVRLADSTMRITAQLIKADSGFHIWSKTYDRHLEDVFEVQEDIAENIAAALDVYLNEEARKKMFAFGTRNVLAYNAYLKGLNAAGEFHKKGETIPGLFVKANPLFEKAILIDPDFAAPYYYHSDAYLHYLLEYSKVQIDTLSILEAKTGMLADFKNAIEHAANPGQQIMFKLEKTFISDNWTQLPSLIQKLKNSPEAQKAFARLGGGWSKTFLNAIGYAHLQYQLSKNALKFDPLNLNFKIAIVQGLINFASADSIIKAMNNFSLLKKYPAKTMHARFFAFVRDKQFGKAASIAQEAATKDFKSYNLILQAVRGEKKEALKNFKSLSSKHFQIPYALASLHYVLGNTKKANDLAQKINNTPLGSLTLMRYITNSGGFLAFDLAALPKLAQKFKAAGVEVRPIQAGHVTLPKIVQKGL